MDPLEIALTATGSRLDQALAAARPDLSRTQWQQLIKEGRVTLAGQPLKPSMRLSGGEVVQVFLPEVVDVGLVPQEIPLDIRYEDADLLVVNKPAGMVVHPGTGHESGTLVNAVLYHCPDLPGIRGERRPGVVHRLDKETSGLVVMAKNEVALRFLQAQFKSRTVEKEYLALVDGLVQPPQAIIDAPIGRDPRNRKRMAVIRGGTARSREAQTGYETAATYAAHTLLACTPHTGRTHQIRVHLAYIGFPIVGDRVYGRRKPSLPLARHFLHARRLAFARPADGTRLQLEAELPAPLASLLQELGGDQETAGRGL